MARDTVTLALDGQVTLRDFAVAVHAFHRLIDALGEQAKAAGIEWKITGLEYGSAIATARGVPSRPDEAWVVEKVVSDYYAVGQAAKSGRLADFFPKKVATPARDLVGVINGHVKSVRFETPDDDVTVFGEDGVPAVEAGTEPVAKAAPLPTDWPDTSVGSVRGRVQTLSNRGELRFTLYDIEDDHAISCYLTDSEDNEETMRGAWGALVSVEGVVRRDHHGRAMTVRQVSSVQVLEQFTGNYWDALGAVKTEGDAALPEDVLGQIPD